MKRFIQVHLNRGTNEIHIIFVNPGMLPNTPKQFEQQRRDATGKISANHCCDDLSNATPVHTGKWRETFINCRECERNLVKYLGKFILDNIATYLNTFQRVYVAGATDNHLCWYVQGRNSPQPEPRFSSNAEEADTRVWLHVKNSTSSKILVESCDTDVYHIGFPLECVHVKKVIIRISRYNAQQMKFIKLSEFVNTLLHDPDLVSINPSILPRVIQSLYTLSGCDYISFFSQLGKATFLSDFFEYASFITAGNTDDAPGTLACTDVHGFLSFIRLIGVTYFKKHSSAFEVESPVAHFRKCKDGAHTHLQHHQAWLESIRQTIWDRITFENQMIPSDCALRLHWERNCWVLHIWQPASRNTMALEPLSECGWSVTEGSLNIVWDTKENAKTIRARVALLLQGCSCKTGCNTKRCKCVKSNHIGAQQDANV